MSDVRYLELDHVVPYAQQDPRTRLRKLALLRHLDAREGKGFPPDPAYQLLCGYCNKRKGTRTGQ